MLFIQIVMIILVVFGVLWALHEFMDNSDGHAALTSILFAILMGLSAYTVATYRGDHKMLVGTYHDLESKYAALEKSRDSLYQRNMEFIHNIQDAKDKVVALKVENKTIREESQGAVKELKETKAKLEQIQQVIKGIS